MPAPTKPRYEAYDLQPDASRTMNHRARRVRPWTPTTFDVLRLVQPTAVATIRKAFMQSNVSRDDWASLKRYGRLDARAGVRAAQGSRDIFRNRGAQSTTKVRCTILVDGSGSMHGGGGMIPVDAAGHKVPVERAEAAAVFGATVAQALGKVPTVNVEVWQHDGGSGSINLKWRWAKGTPVAVFNGAARWRGGYGGNADGHALMAIGERALKQARPGEKVMVMVVSDGQPSTYSRDGRSEAGQALIDAVRTLRSRGVIVLGVAIDGSDQKVYYGDGLVTFEGNWVALGRTLAKQIGATLAGRTIKGRA
jgi:hypothetical protein